MLNGPVARQCEYCLGAYELFGAVQARNSVLYVAADADPNRQSAPVDDGGVRAEAVREAMEAIACPLCGQRDAFVEAALLQAEKSYALRKWFLWLVPIPLGACIFEFFRKEALIKLSYSTWYLVASCAVVAAVLSLLVAILLWPRRSPVVPASGLLVKLRWRAAAAAAAESRGYRDNKTAGELREVVESAPGSYGNSGVAYLGVVVALAASAAAWFGFVDNAIYTNTGTLVSLDAAGTTFVVTQNGLAPQTFKVESTKDGLYSAHVQYVSSDAPHVVRITQVGTAYAQEFAISRGLGSLVFFPHAASSKQCLTELDGGGRRTLRPKVEDLYIASRFGELVTSEGSEEDAERPRSALQLVACRAARARTLRIVTPPKPSVVTVTQRNRPVQRLATPVATALQGEEAWFVDAFVSLDAESPAKVQIQTEGRTEELTEALVLPGGDPDAALPETRLMFVPNAAQRGLCVSVETAFYSSNPRAPMYGPARSIPAIRKLVPVQENFWEVPSELSSWFVTPPKSVQVKQSEEKYISSVRIRSCAGVDLDLEAKPMKPL